MQKKTYPKAFKKEVVQFYERNHTVSETLKKYGIAESTLFDWKANMMKNTSSMCGSRPKETIPRRAGTSTENGAGTGGPCPLPLWDLCVNR